MVTLLACGLAYLVQMNASVIREAKWELVHAEGIGFQEVPLPSQYAANKIAISANGEYMVMCGPGCGFRKEKGDQSRNQSPWLRIWRTTMYPNLYPEWPLLLYGTLSTTEQALRSTDADPAEPSEAMGYTREVQVCQVSEDGRTVLWASAKNSSLASTNDPLEGEAKLLLRVATRKEHESNGPIKARTFKVIHPRDGHGRVWNQADLPTTHTAASSAALSRDGKWLATWDGTSLLLACTEATEARVDKLLFPHMIDSGSGKKLKIKIVFSPDSQCIFLLPSMNHAACLSPDNVWERADVSVADKTTERSASCVSEVTVAGLDGGMETTMWGNRHWAGDCDDETMWGHPAACHANDDPSILRFLLAMAGCGDTSGHVNLVLVTRSNAQLSSQHLQTLHYRIERNAEIVLGAASSGRVIAIAEKGGNTLDIWRWTPRGDYSSTTLPADKNSDENLDMRAISDQDPMQKEPWGEWVQEQSLSISVNGVVGLAVLVLRRTYVLVAGKAGLHVIMDMHDNPHALALARQVCMLVFCFFGIWPCAHTNTNTHTHTHTHTGVCIMCHVHTNLYAHKDIHI